MKIKPEHYDKLRSEIGAISLGAIAQHRAFLLSPTNPRPPKDIEMRLRWDVLHMAIPSVWVCDNLYPYLHDTHIDSALKAIMAEISGPK